MAKALGTVGKIAGFAAAIVQFIPPLAPAAPWLQAIATAPTGPEEIIAKGAFRDPYEWIDTRPESVSLDGYAVEHGGWENPARSRHEVCDPAFAQVGGDFKRELAGGRLLYRAQGNPEHETENPSPIAQGVGEGTSQAGSVWPERARAAGSALQGLWCKALSGLG